MPSIRYVIGRDSVQFSVDGKPVVIAKTHLNYDAILAGLAAGRIDEVKPLLVEIRQSIADSSDGMLTHRDNKLYYGDEVLHGSLVTRILSLVRDGYDVAPLANFLRNLLRNPSKRAVDELYLFLEKCNLPITADGHFIAYKMVKSDFTDKYSGTMDNSPGKVVEMHRWQVDEDKDRTCSDGLHFASLHYVTDGHFGSRSSGDRLIALEINPADVVAIPSDYDNSKGRACRYRVIKELDWDDRLPVHTDGFNFIKDDDLLDGPDAPDVATDDSVQAPAGAVQQRPGQRLWSDDEIRKVKVLLALPDPSLTVIAFKTGMSRRQVARIRDGEVGVHVTV